MTPQQRSQPAGAFSPFSSPPLQPEPHPSKKADSFTIGNSDGKCYNSYVDKTKKQERTETT